MVSIPSSQIKNIIYIDQNLNNRNLKKLKSKLERKSVVDEARKKGYFLNITTEYLNETFNIKSDNGSIFDKDNIGSLRDLEFIDLNDHKIQRLMCLEYCTNLVYLNVSHNCVSDIEVLQSCRRLTCLDVSSNLIDKLPGALFWESLKSLRFLYVHDNPISEPDSVIGLCGSPNLILLTLSNTPLSLKRRYRHFLVNSIWSLEVLDNFFVSDEEIIEDADFKDSYFRSQSSRLKFQSHRTCTDASSVKESLRHFVVEINRNVSHMSPVTIIQKWVRGFLCRKKHNTIRRPVRLQKHSAIRMPKVPEEMPLVAKTVKENFKFLKIDLKHLQTSLTIENLEREAVLIDSMAPANYSCSNRSATQSDKDKCSRDHISRALTKDLHQMPPVTRMPSEIRSFTFRLMGVNPPSTKIDPTSEMMIEKNRSHFAIREADRMFHEDKLISGLPEIKSKPVTKTNSNFLFRKSQGCMGLFLLNKWDKTDLAVCEMDIFQEKVAKIDSIRYERELKLQDLSDGTLRRITNIKKSHEEHRHHVSQSVKTEMDKMQMKIEDLKTRQDESFRQSSKIKNEMSFSHNFRTKQSAASNAIDRFERLAIKQDQLQANVSNVTQIRENISLKMEDVKSYVENQVRNIRAENNLERSALDMQLFQQMNNRMNDAKMRVEKLKTIQRLVSCPKLNIVEMNLETLPTV